MRRTALCCEQQFVHDVAQPSLRWLIVSDRAVQQISQCCVAAGLDYRISCAVVSRSADSQVGFSANHRSLTHCRRVRFYASAYSVTHLDSFRTNLTASGEDLAKLALLTIMRNLSTLFLSHASRETCVVNSSYKSGKYIEKLYSINMASVKLYSTLLKLALRRLRCW